MQINFGKTRKVEINGKEYSVQRSSFEVYAIGKEAMRRCAVINPESVESVRDCIAWLVEQVDFVLGIGAMRDISGGAPIDIVNAMRILTHLSATCGEEYRDYVRTEYIQSEQT